MSTAQQELENLLADPPPDLVVHFDAVAAMSDCRPLLELARAVSTSQQFRKFHPLAKAMGLVFLDDENTSNYHTYITVGPLAGTILYLNHDGDTTVVFSSLAGYLDAVRATLASGKMLYKVHPQLPVLARDQSALTARIRRLIDEDEEPELLVLIASWDASDEKVLKKLVRHSNFFVAEAIGDAMARRPRRSSCQLPTCSRSIRTAKLRTLVSER